MHEKDTTAVPSEAERGLAQTGQSTAHRILFFARHHEEQESAAARNPAKITLESTTANFIWEPKRIRPFRLRFEVSRDERQRIPPAPRDFCTLKLSPDQLWRTPPASGTSRGSLPK
jgi:hypothetical protein